MKIFKSSSNNYNKLSNFEKILLPTALLLTIVVFFRAITSNTSNQRKLELDELLSKEGTNAYLDPHVWGPHYWFFLHTITLTYPHHPNAVTKKKYYEFIQSLPIFIPVDRIAKEFEKLIDLYPVTPYLDNRESFVKWMHFIHNKVNEQVGNPQFPLEDFFVKYYNEYNRKDDRLSQYYKVREKFIYGGILASILTVIYYLYYK